jgi:predicted acyltransferase
MPWEQGSNLADWIDVRVLPGSLYKGNHDPEGLLSTLPALANCIAGYLAGAFLWEKGEKPAKAAFLAKAGAMALGLALLWSTLLPLNKNLWSSSFALLNIGISCMLLALFYESCEVLEAPALAKPFAWLGANPIFLYLLSGLLGAEDLAKRFVGGDVALLLKPYDALAASLLGLAFIFLLARFLYRREIFIKI